MTTLIFNYKIWKLGNFFLFCEEKKSDQTFLFFVFFRLSVRVRSRGVFLFFPITMSIKYLVKSSLFISFVLFYFIFFYFFFFFFLFCAASLAHRSAARAVADRHVRSGGSESGALLRNERARLLQGVFARTVLAARALGPRTRKGGRQDQEDLQVCGVLSFFVFVVCLFLLFVFSFCSFCCVSLSLFLFSF